MNAVTTPIPGNGISAEATRTLYDTSLRPYNVTEPDSGVVSSTYLLTGELWTQSGARVYPVAYSYDYAGRMATMTNWSTGPTGLRTEVTTWNYDPHRGWLANEMYDNQTAGPSYTYTFAGRLYTRTWARGSMATYTYDYSGAIKNISYNDNGVTPAVAYFYDRPGRQKTVTFGAITDTLWYNLADQLLGETYSGGNVGGLAVTNIYDNYLRRTNVTVFNGTKAVAQENYSFDNASRLSTASDGTPNADNAYYTYLANSPLVSQIAFKQNGAPRMTNANSYDFLNRLTKATSTPVGSIAMQFGYTCNNANQRTNDVSADGSHWVYGYDSFGQLTNGCKFWNDGTPVAGQQYNYTFDMIGNRLQTLCGGDSSGAATSLSAANYVNNTLNQLNNRGVPGNVNVIGASLLSTPVTVNGQTAYRRGEYFWEQLPANNSSSALWMNIVASGSQTFTGNIFVPQTPEQFTYDADGNLHSDGRWIYIWDGENRLTKMVPNTTVGPQYSVTFAYDYQGRRIQKSVTLNGVVTSYNFVYDGWTPVAELDKNKSLLRSYVWGNDLSGQVGSGPNSAGGIGGLLEVTYCGLVTTNCFTAFEGNGNLSALVNATDGTIVANYEYGPFGEVIRATGPMAKANPFRFSTKYQDDESDLLYYGYRYYNLSAGRWASRDPLDTGGGLNLYGFVSNDSINSFDALGLVDYKFEVVRGNPYPFNKSGFSKGVGSWGQPFYTADGFFGITDTFAYSRVTITGCTEPSLGYIGNACNTVNNDEASGSIELYLRNDCPAVVQVNIHYKISLNISGPHGAALANIKAGGKTLVSMTARPKAGSIERDDELSFPAVVGKDWKVAAIYAPSISVPSEKGNPDVATAKGTIRVISIND